MADINPRVDIAFKKIFGVEENKDLLISLINSIVSEEDQVQDVVLLNPYNSKDFKNDKLSILDIKAKGISRIFDGETVAGKRYNIEIQISDEGDYDKRALFYWAKLYTDQLKSGDDYDELNKAIGIHILNFTTIPGMDNYHNVFCIKEKNHNIEYFNDLELHTIELRKFSDNREENIEDIVKKIKNSLDIWVAFLTKLNLMNRENLPKKLNNSGLDKALGVLNVMDFDGMEREVYENHLKWLRIQSSTLKKKFAAGQVEGMKKGVKKGMKRGIAKGKIEGEKSKAIEIAKKLLESGVSDEIILSASGLAKSDLDNLKKCN